MATDNPAEGKKPAPALDSPTTTPPDKPEESLFDRVMGPDKPPATVEKPPATAEKPPAATADKPALPISDNVEDNPLFKGPSAPPEKPPAAADKPPAAADKPPAAADKPPAAADKPPAAADKPPAAADKPPAAADKPPAAADKPPAAADKPIASLSNEDLGNSYRTLKAKSYTTEGQNDEGLKTQLSAIELEKRTRLKAELAKGPEAFIKAIGDIDFNDRDNGNLTANAFGDLCREGGSGGELKYSTKEDGSTEVTFFMKQANAFETVKLKTSKPDAEEVKLLAAAVKKQADQRSAAPAEIPPAATDQPPAASDKPPAAADKVEIIKPELKAAVDDKISKLVQHINNGAALLKEGKIEETVNAYRAAADLVSPEEQKLFIQEQNRVSQLIKDEMLKPAEQQDAKKLEEMKTLELNLKTLGRVDIFTEVNAGLIYTQTGDMAKAGEAFAKAFKNEKALLDEKLIPDLYLMKDPNLGARINEISKNTGVDIRGLMGNAVAQAGVDPKLVGLDTGRGPPAATDQPPAATDKPPAATDKPPAATDKPPAATDKPPAATDKPPAATDKPPAATDKPPAATDTPPAATDKPPVAAEKPPEAAPEKAIEAAVVFSPTDKAGRSPIEQVGFWIDKANENKQLTKTERDGIEAAIAAADKGVSPKLAQLEKRAIELTVDRAKVFESVVPGTTEKVGDGVGRVDTALLGVFEQDKDTGVVRQTKEGLLDKLMPPADYPMSAENKAAMPPADYKPSTPKPADSKLSDADYRIEAYRNDLRTYDYRLGVRSLYTSLDESMNEEAYKQTLAKLKSVLPPDSKSVLDAITERDKITTSIRPIQFELNMTMGRIPAEKNQSAMARALYADLLATAGDDEGAKRYFKEAYAFNQIPVQTEEYRTMAMEAGVSPIELLEAAVNQNHERGGAKRGKALEVEHLLAEADLIFSATPAEKQAEIAAKLTPSLEKLQLLSNAEAAQVEARSKALLADYQRTLPPTDELKTELKGLERKMIEAEKNFTPAELALIEATLDFSTTPEDRAKAKEELKKTQGQWVTDSDRYKEILGDKAKDYSEVKSKIAFHMVDVSKSTKNLFMSRAVQANMLNETGNKDGAKAKLTEAFGAIPDKMRDKVLETDPKIAEFTKKVGLDAAAIKALPNPNIEGLAKPPAVAEKPPAAGDKPPAAGDQPPAAGDKPPVAAENPGRGKDVPAGRVLPVPGADPRFIEMTDQALDRKIAEKNGKMEHVEEIKDMYKELIRRYESDLTKEQFNTSIPSIKLLGDALKAGKELTGPDEARVVGTEDLTPDRRWDFHQAIFADMESLHNQIRIRQEYAQFLKASDQYKDAEIIALEARDYAERLMKPVEIDGKQVRPIDLMQDEADRLVSDQTFISDPKKREEMDKASWVLIGTNLDSGTIKSPINTNKFLAQLYLGTKIIPKLNEHGKPVGIQDVQFGKSSAFKPERALDAANRALAHTRDILKLDPLDAKTAKENPGVASLFGVLADVVDKPEKYKLYVGKKGETYVNEEGKTVYLKGGELVGKNDANVPVLIEAHSIQNLKNMIKKDSAVDSLLTDMVVTLGMGFAAAAIRNPRLAAAVESGAGKYWSHAGVAFKATGYTAIVGGGILGRHYGHQYLTGVEESWTDSIVHVAGSVAAAEVGGRLSGRGSFITGAPGSVRQFAKFDTQASAQFLDKQGYKTTGQVMDLLNSQGFIKEAKEFVGMPRATKLLAEGGTMEAKVLEALEKANLKGARMGSVSEAILKDVKLSSGIKEDVLAARVAQADAGGVKTIRDLEKLVQADQKALEGLKDHVINLDNAAKITPEVLAGNPQAAQLLATAEKYGLKNVGQVKALAAESHKIGFDRVFPKLAEMRSANLINGGTKITDAVAMGTHALEGPGLQRMLNLVPAADRAALFTPAALKEVMATSAITGERSILQRLKDGRDAVWNGTVSTYNTVRHPIQSFHTARTAVGNVLAPLKTGSFYTKTIPTAARDATVFSFTKLNDARKVVTDRFAIRAIDPAKATPEALSRARFAGGFYGGLGAAGVYNTVVKPYDMTGQVFGVSLPQYGGDGKPHAIFTREDGEDMRWIDALKESHFPTITGIGDREKMPWYAKSILIPVAEAAIGTPGQALFGAVFLKPGAIYKPIWSNPEHGPVKKTFQSFFPLSPTRWNNWNAGAFSGPTLGAASVLPGALVPSAVDNLGNRLKVRTLKEILAEAQKEVENKPLPPQHTDIADAVPKPGAAEVVKPTANPPKVDDKKPAVEPKKDLTEADKQKLEKLKTLTPGSKEHDALLQELRNSGVVAPVTPAKPKEGKPEEPPPPGTGS